MTARGDEPERVLVVWCPGWEAPGLGGDTGPGAAAGHQAADFGQVVSAVEGLCPRVEVLRPGACAIAVRGPARYFGGEDPLAAKIIEAVAGCGLTCRVGIAEGLFAAHLAAVAGRTAGHHGRARSWRWLLAGHGRFWPRSRSACWTARIARIWRACSPAGRQDAGGFRVAACRRGGEPVRAPGVLAHRLARGLSPRPLVPRPPPVDLSVCKEFDPPVGQAEPVVFAAKALAQRMHDRLAASTLTCVRVRVQVLWEDGREITRLWRHDGLLSALAVAERVRWQLAGWQPGQAGQADRAGGQADRAGGQADRQAGRAAGRGRATARPTMITPTTMRSRRAGSCCSG